VCDSSPDRTDLLMHRATMQICNGPECEQTRAGNGQGNPLTVVRSGLESALSTVARNQLVPLDSKSLLTDDSVLRPGSFSASQRRSIRIWVVAYSQLRSGTNPINGPSLVLVEVCISQLAQQAHRPPREVSVSIAAVDQRLVGEVGKDLMRASIDVIEGQAAGGREVPLVIDLRGHHIDDRPVRIADAAFDFLVVQGSCG
jgi:hypothetical protein